MTTSPDIAVCGAGLIGKRHVEQAAKQARLCAIIDPSEAGKALAQEYDVPYFAALDECLTATKPDGVVIATPNHLHADQTIQCLSEGVPVLIEKPIADTVENADRIVAAVAQTGVPTLVGHHRRHNPLIKRAKALIESGALGELVAITGQFWLYKPDDYFDATWRTRHGGGPLLINCIHDVDLLRHLCGEVSDLKAMRSTKQRGYEVEDTLALILQFKNGALGSFSVSDTVVSPWSWELTSGENPIYPKTTESCYRIGGTQASLSIPDMRVWSHDGPRSWWNAIGSEHLATSDEDAFAAQFTHFLDVIGGAPSLVTAQEGCDSLAIVLRALQTDPD